MSRKWCAEDIPDQHGKVVVITGANSGLGFESALALAGRGAEVILACRDKNAAAEAIDTISRVTGLTPGFIALDLQSFSSVKDFAEAFTADYQRLDVLINNAGIMNTPYKLTAEGLEQQMATNHLGHFALTGRLLDILKNTWGSRVVTVSSLAHKSGKLDFRDMFFSDPGHYSPFKAYARSKLANLLFAFELDRLFRQYGYNSISLAAHPGASQTNLGRHIEGAPLFTVLNPVLERIVQGQDRGALPQLFAATMPDVKGGEYYGPDGLFELSGHPVKVKPSANTRNQAMAKRLWELSERATDMRWAF